MTVEQYIEQKVTTIYSGGMNAVRVVAEKDALSAIDLARGEMVDNVCEYLSKLTRFVCCSEGGGVEQPVFTDAEIELFKHKIMEE